MASSQVAESNRETKIRKRKPEEFQEKKKKEFVPYLNDDIMFHIFLRVPAIALFGNCRFLCKQWSSLIYNQNFLKPHFLRSEPGILLTEDIKIKGKNAQVLKYKETETGKVHNLHTLKREDVFEDVFVLGCAGLCILLSDSTNINHVMNLVTKESIRLPRHTNSFLGKQLVFDRANMNYKIVYYKRQGIDGHDFIIGDYDLMIYLLELDGSCKLIKGPRNTTLGTAVLVNGVLHCRAYYHEDEKGLWCMDLSNETCCYLRWPIDLDISLPYSLWDAGGFVCFMTIGVSEEINIWILRQQKWVQICYIDSKEQPLPDEGLRDIRFKRDLQCVGCLDNAERFVFMTDFDRLDAYNVKTKQWMMIKPDDNNVGVANGIYVPSILPLT